MKTWGWMAALALVPAGQAVAQRATPGVQAVARAPAAVPSGTLLARYYVAVRRDATTTVQRSVRVKAKSGFSGPVTVVARNVTTPGQVAATKSGSVGGLTTLTLTLPPNGTSTSPYCLESQHHYQISVFAGAAGSDPLALQVQSGGARVEMCRGVRGVWFTPSANYPGNAVPPSGASNQPAGYAACLAHEAKVVEQPGVYRPGEDPWPDPDPGIAVNPDLSACR